jgi:hypothetical protein
VFKELDAARAALRDTLGEFDAERAALRDTIGKQAGDTVHVRIDERISQELSNSQRLPPRSPPVATVNWPMGVFPSDS